MPAPKIDIPTDALVAFCRKWWITEFSLFGSVLRDDFGEDSDVDVLVVFDAGADWDLDHWEEMTAELQALFERKVDIVERRWIRNPFKRHSILTSRRSLYAA